MNSTYMNSTGTISSEKERVFQRIYQRPICSFHTFNRLNKFQQRLLIKLTGRTRYTRMALHYMAIKKRDGEPVRVRKAARFALRNYNKYLKWISNTDQEFVFMRRGDRSLKEEFMFMGFKPIDQVKLEQGMCYIMSNTDIGGTRMVHPQPCYGYITKRRPGVPNAYEFHTTNGIPGYTKVWRPKEELDEMVSSKKRRR